MSRVQISAKEVLLAVVVLIAAGAASGTAWLSQTGSQLARMGLLAQGVVTHDGPTLLLAALAAILLLLTVRYLCIRSVLRSRPDGLFPALPTNSFSASLADVESFGNRLTAAQRALLAWLYRPAMALGVRIAANPDGELTYAYEVPARSRSALRTAVSAYPEVELVVDGEEAVPVEEAEDEAGVPEWLALEGEREEAEA